jgi:hypothetical protein
VAVAAGLVAALRVSVILYELGMEWTHGTGLFAGIAWAVGTGVASVFVVVAIIGIVVETLCGQPSV